MRFCIYILNQLSGKTEIMRFTMVKFIGNINIQVFPSHDILSSEMVDEGMNLIRSIILMMVNDYFPQFHVDFSLYC